MNERLSNLQTVLIVDDNEDDYTAIKRSFQKVQLPNPVFWCRSGQEALDYLKNEGEFKNAPPHEKPGLILIDLNMPGIDGHRVLQILKSDPEFKKIPVIILTTSNNEHDITGSFEEGANSYVQKPITFEELLKAIKGLKEYWFEISTLPIKQAE